ncbi:hypothetical protein RN001_006116 [Aquatica leii]|uniref:Protein SERAC1 n=1 Tax=Aquatica leii TaxID=1421715 RepID=A0AAN7SIF0_9COLE|nr:hypothetical protein RN001_006116 [Aquatica leii]
MQFYQKNKKFLQVSGMIVATSSVGWLLLEIRRTYKILNNILDTSIVNFLEPPKYPEFEADLDDSFIFSNWIKMHDVQNAEPHSIWKSLKFTYARQLINLTTSDNAFVRDKIIKQLATITNLENWHYSYLSQLIDAKTAIGLARTKSADRRYFAKPPFMYVGYTHEMLVSSMKDLLVALNRKSSHSCMEYFINKAFVDQDVEHSFIDHESTSSELRKLIKTATDILPLCLDSLLHHCALNGNAKDIVTLNGLPLLMEIYNRFQDNFEVKLKLCNLLSNISVYPDLLGEIYRSGWITVLSCWLNECDIRLSATAAKTLANLDDNNYNALYPNKIYVLHPLHRLNETANVDVIFVHGLLGGVFFTWRQKRRSKFSNFFSTYGFKKTLTDVQSKLLRTSDPIVREFIQDTEVTDQLEFDQVGHDFEFVLNDIPITTNVEATGPYTCSGVNDCITQAQKDCYTHTMCWPKDWLPQDCKNLRILGINYDTSLSMWAQICPNEQRKATIEERSDEFLSKLLAAGVGERPIIWITHSMGGLIVKNLLWKAWGSGSEVTKKICSNSKAIVFFSTPHIGSRVANLSPPTALLLWPSVEIQELREESVGLIKIHENFLKLTKQIPLKVISFVETKSTLVTAMKFNLQFVDARSGNPSIGEYFEVPQDHLGICKPSSRMSFLYQKVVHLIRDIVEKTNQEKREEYEKLWKL